MKPSISYQGHVFLDGTKERDELLRRIDKVVTLNLDAILDEGGYRYGGFENDRQPKRLKVTIELED